jgi:4'-phosphopantetheinyl transferase
MNAVLPPRKLPASVVEVWQFDLDMRLHPGIDLDSILSVEERSRADRYVFARDANRFRLCRAMLRLGLGWYLGANPRELALTVNEYGKPRLRESSAAPHFNVTHSEGLGLIAFTGVGEVGIDAEAVRREVDALEVASAHFTEREAAMVAAAMPEEQAGTFLRLWTRKEAALKAAGVGIGRGLSAFDVSRTPDNLARLSGGSEGSHETLWMVRDMEVIDGFVGAVAAAAGDWSIRQWPIRSEDAIDSLIAQFDKLLQYAARSRPPRHNDRNGKGGKLQSISREADAPPLT